MSDRSGVMALIGAGPVGLGMAKALLEHKIAYEELEANCELGGNWLHGVYETVHIISSRKTTEYADYPMPEDYPDFPSRQQMLDYLRDYAEKFQLTRQIQYKSCNGFAFAGRALGIGAGQRREAHLQRIDCLQRASLGPALPELSGEIRGRIHSLQRLPDSRGVGGKARAGDWRRKFRLRHCRGSRARGKNGAHQSAARLLVSAKDVVRGSVGGINSAVVSGVGATDFFATFSASRGRKIFGLRFAGARSQNFRSTPDHQQRAAVLHEARTNSAAAGHCAV